MCAGRHDLIRRERRDLKVRRRDARLGSIEPLAKPDQDARNRIALLIRRLEEPRRHKTLPIHDECSGEWNPILRLVRWRHRRVQDSVRFDRR